ncbi:hypothetical protein [Frankia sp. AgB32]|uniref:hypothetical protein n=1 Tax=Frankia sp. AgB32 TaxID=631119 RepID=UPI00200BC65B|nr:hypothetical protein [Frankia sp. AgB32]MCK9895325.1 hypothetical protein [Frankia sp. AgB32]
MTRGAARLADPDEAAQVPHWSPVERWLWLLASRSAHSDYPPDPDDADALLAGLVRLSADWRALINRDGAAFLGLRRDLGASDPYFGFAKVYMHTVYLDALLLGMTQRLSIDQLTDSAARSFQSRDLASHLMELEIRAAHFRAMYWLRDTGDHGHATQILAAYQGQYDLDARFHLVVNEISELARVVQARGNEQVSAALGVITVLGLPIGVTLGIVQIIGANGVVPVSVALGASFSATAVILHVHEVRPLPGPPAGAPPALTSAVTPALVAPSQPAWPPNHGGLPAPLARRWGSTLTGARAALGPAPTPVWVSLDSRRKMS